MIANVCNLFRRLLPYIYRLQDFGSITAHEGGSATILEVQDSAPKLVSYLLMGSLPNAAHKKITRRGLGSFIP